VDQSRPVIPTGIPPSTRLQSVLTSAISPQIPVGSISQPAQPTPPINSQNLNPQTILSIEQVAKGKSILRTRKKDRPA